jgi:hypothetical protein
MRQQSWLSLSAGSRMEESGRMPLAGLELWLRLHRLQNRATLLSNLKLSVVLCASLCLCTPKTNLLQLRQGWFLIWCSSQSQATLSINSKLSVLLDALFPIITTTSLLQLQQGRYLICRSSLSQEFLLSNSKLSLLLDALSASVTTTRLQQQQQGLYII